MKNLLAVLLLSVTITAWAQDGAERVTFSNLKLAKDSVVLDSIKTLVSSGRLKQYITAEKEMYNKADKVNRFAVVNEVVKKLSNNGSEDISKCFYPRHSINFYKGDKLVKCILICFECYGLRFSDERWITKVKNEKKRIELMDELKVRFISEGF